MEVKICNPMKVLLFSAETSMVEMIQFVRVKANELYREALACEMEITGPVYWVYKGADGNPQTRFVLEICLPVYCTKSYQGSFKLSELPPLKCMHATHYGSWGEMGNIYHHLFDTLFANNHQPNGITREMYVNMDFENPENNVTEIQVGIL